MITDAAKHLEALHVGSTLTEWFRREFRPKAVMVRPERVFRALRDANVRFVVMGTHGINGYRDQARATQDVDILVRPTDHARAIEVVHKAYRKLEVDDTAVVTRFLDPTTGKVVIDLMKPKANLLLEAFKYCVAVGDSHRIPDLEMAIASKYAAMISPNRSNDRKHIDAGDFLNMLRQNENKLDRKKLKRLGDLVYKGGGEELLQYVEDGLAGKTLQI
jgi:hypothetical protein